MPRAVLRVLDFGPQIPLRSQTLWHAIAHGVSEGEPPTLSFVTPSSPYVSVGYHRRLDEIDFEGCRARGLPVFRRMGYRTHREIDAERHALEAARTDAGAGRARAGRDWVASARA